MKQLILLFLLIATACKVPGDKTIGPPSEGDPFQVYLTSDIAINSCLLSWEKLETYTLTTALDGELDVFQTPFSDLVPKEERARSFSFKTMDQSTGKEYLIPMEHIELHRVQDGFKLVQSSPFDGEEITCGYVKTDDLLRLSPSGAKQLLQMLVRFNQLPRLNTPLTGSEMYTASLLLLDTLQKDFAWQGEVKKKYSYLDENLNAMSDSLFNEQIHQLEDSLGPDGQVHTKMVRISGYDLWKGFMVYGTLSSTQLSWKAFGLLYHPDTKFGSFNPGKILWFAVPAPEIEKADPEMYRFLVMLAQNALLYSADPSRYRSQYFLNNSITIDNGRYPKK